VLMGFFVARAELSGEGEFVASLPVGREVVSLVKSLAFLIVSLLVSLACFLVSAVFLKVAGALGEVGVLWLFAASAISSVGLWGFSLLGASLSVLGIPGVIVALVSSQVLALLPAFPAEYVMWASGAVILGILFLVSACDRWPHVFAAFILFMAYIFASWAKVHPSPAAAFSAFAEGTGTASSFISSLSVSLALCALYMTSFGRREW